ncbi:MAG: hypothetical protein PHO70_00725 [Candidatus Omnitrophica bacterium]|nr:hypothetical protein [Candidatus Omnitrophota bacterium]
MYSPKIRKLLIIFLIIGWAGTAVFLSSRKPVKPKSLTSPDVSISSINSKRTVELLSEAIACLKLRKDNEGLALFNEVLAMDPFNLDALWGKAEIMRRRHKYSASEEILKRVIDENPTHAPSLVTLAYIKYSDNKINEALELTNQVIKRGSDDKDDIALAYMMLGAINSKRCSDGWLFGKIKYGTQIKRNFEKAKEISPDLSETHLCMGTFYLKAPAIAGGDLDKAIEELNIAYKMTPDFATVNVRLAQAYKKKGDLDKYNYYLKRAKELDPENEFLNE